MWSTQHPFSWSKPRPVSQILSCVAILSLSVLTSSLLFLSNRRFSYLHLQPCVTIDLVWAESYTRKHTHIYTQTRIHTHKSKPKRYPGCETETHARWMSLPLAALPSLRPWTLPLSCLPKALQADVMCAVYLLSQWKITASSRQVPLTVSFHCKDWSLPQPPICDPAGAWFKTVRKKNRSFGY